MSNPAVSLAVMPDLASYNFKDEAWKTHKASRKVGFIFPDEPCQTGSRVGLGAYRPGFLPAAHSPDNDPSQVSLNQIGIQIGVFP
ncbi:hypothetical protein [Pseudomonas syringae]|uniref:hypothetical protein n=1 Tax=Pseudomonas syringae TaxID=317 RepID=UPI0012AD2804|nr:hypothetical protein [Pseudomonas syringae]